MHVVNGTQDPSYRLDRELRGQLIKYDGRGICLVVDTLAEADGILFLCPKCLFENDGARPGVHSVKCWFTGKVPDDLGPKPGRWTPAGTGLSDLTFVPGAPPKAVSVQLTGGCAWHGYIRNGVGTQT